MRRIPIAMATASSGVVITDPAILASLRPSPEAAARIEQLERATGRPPPRIPLD